MGIIDCVKFKKENIERYKSLVTQWLEDGSCDMVNDGAVSDEEFIKQVAEVMCKIASGTMVVDSKLKGKNDTYLLRVRNTRNSMVSVSNETTGVSNSMYFIVDCRNGEDFDEYLTSNFCSMINEAWYCCES